jgi:hypothetical protein
MMLHVVLPSQHLALRGRTIAEPQRRLMLAVLQTVVDDVQEAADDTGAGAVSSDVRAYWQALAYIESRDRSWPFSFENICETIGLDADGIRRTLRRAPVPQERSA